MLAALFKFLDDAVALGKLSPDYQLHAVGDLTTMPYNGPGTLFREVMETWPQFSKTMNCKRSTRV
jgi:hypothetical protein